MTSAASLVLRSHLKIHGNIKEQSWPFLAKLESYFTINNIPERLKLHVVEQAMSARAHLGWTSLVPEPSCYTEWKEKYLRRHWNESHKFELKSKLMGGNEIKYFGVMTLNKLQEKNTEFQ